MDNWRENSWREPRADKNNLGFQGRLAKDDSELQMEPHKARLGFRMKRNVRHELAASPVLHTTNPSGVGISAHVDGVRFGSVSLKQILATPFPFKETQDSALSNTGRFEATGRWVLFMA